MVKQLAQRYGIKTVSESLFSKGARELPSHAPSLHIPLWLTETTTLLLSRINGLSEPSD
jgi:hypothetical protein